MPRLFYELARCPFLADVNGTSCYTGSQIEASSSTTKRNRIVRAGLGGPDYFNFKSNPILMDWTAADSIWR